MAAPAETFAAIDHAAVQNAAARLFAHLRRCGRCDLRSERLCPTGQRLRDLKYEAVAQKWRR